MPRILYAGRVAKVLDELVRDLGLTVTLDDQKAEVELGSSLENLKVAAGSMGIDVSVETLPTGKTRASFKRR
jgi:hypothetical protein